jgi:hypothetical protein
MANGAACTPQNHVQEQGVTCAAVRVLQGLSTYLMNIKIDDQDSLQGMLLDCRCCGHRNVVEDAETLPPVLRQTVTALSRPGLSLCTGPSVQLSRRAASWCHCWAAGQTRHRV